MFDIETMIDGFCENYCKFYEAHNAERDPPLDETPTCKNCLTKELQTYLILKGENKAWN